MDMQLVWKFLGVKPAAIPIWGLYYKVLCTLTSPEDKMLFMYSKKPSSLISLSVKMKVIPLPCWPAVRYRNFRSSSKLLTLYDLQHKTKCIYSHAHLSWTTTCKSISLGFTLIQSALSIILNVFLAQFFIMWQVCEAQTCTMLLSFCLNCDHMH